MFKIPKRFRNYPIICIIFVILNNRIVNSDKQNPNAVKVNKCCETFEILVDLRCTSVNESVTSEYLGIFVLLLCKY